MRSARRGAAVCALFAPFSASCGEGSSSTPPARDAAVEGASSDAGAGDGPCFPFCGSSSGGDEAGGDGGPGAPGDGSGDGASSCAQLKAVYEALQGPAQACNPQLQGQCAATTNGPCCPVTVSASSQSAVNDFDQAVATYTAQCQPNCAQVICQPAPSNECDPLGGSASQGRCR
jgi:hypothetical protein